MKYIILFGLALMLTHALIKQPPKTPKDTTVTSYRNAAIEEKTFELILTDEELKEYKKIANNVEKTLWLSVYWKKHDPTPTTEVNEYKQEYERRVQYARRNFPSHDDVGFDDRGRIYIKYGEPDERVTQPAGGWHTYPNESWLYIKPEKRIYHFINKGSGYRLVFDLAEANIHRTGAPPDAELYESRAYLDPSYSQIANAIREYYARLGERNEDPLMTETDLLPILNKITQLTDLESGRRQNEYYRAESNLQGFNFRYDYKAKPLHVSFNAANFKGRGSKTNLEVYYGLPFRELRFSADSIGYTAAFECQAVLFDRLMRRRAASSFQRKISTLSKISTKSDSVLVDQLDFYVSPGEYLLVLRIKDLKSNHLGIYKAPVRVRGDFNNEKLGLSDMEISSRVVPTSSLSPFFKEGLEVVPLSTRTIKKKNLLYIYYEIYNLKRGKDGQTRYQKEYKITAVDEKRNLAAEVSAQFIHFFGLKKKRGAITSSFESIGTSEDKAEYLAIDLSNLPPGKYNLRLTVKDKVSGEETSTSTNFEIVH